MSQSIDYIRFPTKIDAVDHDIKCVKCRSGILSRRIDVGNGVTAGPCPICGFQHYQFPDAMKKTTGPARDCQDCGDAVDTDNGKYCRTCRVRRQNTKRWEKKNARSLVL